MSFEAIKGISDAEVQAKAKIAEAEVKARQMLADADRMLTQAGYEPYYMYRQKHMAGNFENVGWCLPGTESLYNIRIMATIV